jgi:hypothetical protein
VRAVQVIPSVDVAAAVDGAAIATKTPFAKVTTFQFAEVGIVLAVQVMPSGEEAASVEAEPPTATQIPLPYATPVHDCVGPGKVLAVAV